MKHHLGVILGQACEACVGDLGSPSKGGRGRFPWQFPTRDHLARIGGLTSVLLAHVGQTDTLANPQVSPHLSAHLLFPQAAAAAHPTNEYFLVGQALWGVPRMQKPVGRQLPFTSRTRKVTDGL